MRATASPTDVCSLHTRARTWYKLSVLLSRALISVYWILLPLELAPLHLLPTHTSCVLLFMHLAHLKVELGMAGNPTARSADRVQALAAAAAPAAAYASSGEATATAWPTTRRSGITAATNGDLLMCLIASGPALITTPLKPLLAGADAGAAVAVAGTAAAAARGDAAGRPRMLTISNPAVLVGSAVVLAPIAEVAADAAGLCESAAWTSCTNCSNAAAWVSFVKNSVYWSRTIHGSTASAGGKGRQWSQL